MRGLQRAKNARNWRIRAGRTAPSGWKHFLASSHQGEGWSESAARSPSPRGRRLPLARCGRWAVNPLIRVSDGDPYKGQMVHVLVFQVNFSASDGCQIVHGAATWCLLFRIDLYALSYVGAIDLVVWQWEVNLSDSERCQTLHMAALWCLVNPRALTSTVRPRHGQFLPRCTLCEGRANNRPNWLVT